MQTDDTQPSSPNQAKSLSVAGRSYLGRSGPRSRSGCVTCKQRRVRCDEVHPICGHCTRLQLNCSYKPRSARWRPTPPVPARSVVGNDLNNSLYHREACVALDQNFRTDVDFLSLGPSRRVNQEQQSHEPISEPLLSDDVSGQASLEQDPNVYWLQPRRVGFSDLGFSDLGTSWAGEFSCLFPEVESPPNLEPNCTINSQSSTSAGAHGSLTASSSVATAISDSQKRLSRHAIANESNAHLQAAESDTHLQRTQEGLSPSDTEDLSPENTSHLIRLFHKIVQPPAAILIGGFERWRRLQNYLCRISEHSRAVNNALLCVIELLMIDELSPRYGQDRRLCMERILQRHQTACGEIRTKLSKQVWKQKAKEHLLAAIFLLAWFEVIHDQDTNRNLFPRELADTIISSSNAWNRYSQQLLSWLNTLDSKATHLGGENLLSPRSLEIVSHFPTQITSSNIWEDSNVRPLEESQESDTPPSETSPQTSHYSIQGQTELQSPILSTGRVKQMMLNTILQPALEWYLTSQSYCRRIGSHDKHHRTRFTTDAEYEVITACKQLESELFDLWKYRPAVISLTASQLTQVVSPDIATRLEEIFSVYLASFWILFVYLHRISWWNLPHSATARRALAEVWRNMQRAYGEVIDGSLKKILHPALLWPLFLFGSECSDERRRMWAVEQLEALGEAKPVLENEDTHCESLPTFRLSSGATRNAKRAAVLLRELVKEQDERKARVDDRDLSMKIFGCYFSIV